MSQSDFYGECHTLTLGRCECAHTHSWIINDILACVLYRRGIVPRLPSQLCADAEDAPKAQSVFADSYNKVRRDSFSSFQSVLKITATIHELFRSRMHASVQEVTIMLGQSIVQPNEIYRIRAPKRCAHECNGEKENGSPLSARDHRNIAQQLFSLAETFRWKIKSVCNALNL